MKNINEYIAESASLFDDDYNSYSMPPSNYINYNEGDKTFGELQKGDEVYLYTYAHDEILNITIDGKLTVGRKDIHIKTKSFNLNPSIKKMTSNDIVLGPVYSSRMAPEGSYDPDKVKESSICVSYSGGWAVGTNKEAVLKYAKSDISNSINKIQNDIKDLQNQIETLNKKLENIK